MARQAEFARDVAGQHNELGTLDVSTATLGARCHDHTLRKGDLVLSLAAGAGMNVAGALYHC